MTAPKYDFAHAQKEDVRGRRDRQTDRLAIDIIVYKKTMKQEKGHRNGSAKNFHVL